MSQPVWAINAKITTAPASEPVSLTEAKLHLRIDHSTEDSLITSHIETARQIAEDISGRAFFNRTLTATLDCWPASGIIKLPSAPLVSVTSVKYTDEDGAQSTWASSNYIVDTQNEPGRIVFTSDSTLPSVTLQEVNGIEIVYVAGYGTNTDDIPERYKQGMLLLIGHLYENRETVITAQGYNVAELPFGAVTLLQMDKVW